MKKWLVLILALGLVGCGDEKKEEVEILWYGLFDDRVVYDEMIKEYEELTPGVKVVYRKLTEDEYWEQLDQGVGSGKVDVFMLPYQEVRKWVPDLAVSKNILKEGLESDFVFAGSETCLWNEEVICVPADAPTLALIYNPNLVEAKITWEEMMKEARRLHVASKEILGGVAFGTFENMTRGEEILALMMMQKGVKWFDENWNLAWDEKGGTDEKGFPRFLGKEVLGFWNGNETWDEGRGYYADEFATGKLGMMIGYPWMMKRIKQAEPDFEMEVAPIPFWAERPENDFSLGDGWVFGVSRVSENEEVAWDLIEFVTGPKNAARYAEGTQTVPARIDLLKRLEGQGGAWEVWIEQAKKARNLPQYHDWGEIWGKLREWVLEK